MGGVENHPVARFTHPIERTEIGDEIVVAKAGPTLGKSKLVVTEAGELFRDILHVPRGEELTFLYVDHPSGFGRRPDQICLPAKEGGDLENVNALTRDLRFRRRMDIGCDWDFQFRSNGRENFASFADPDSTVGTDRSSIRLVVRRLKNECHRFGPADFRDAAPHPPDKLFRFNHTRSKDE